MSNTTDVLYKTETVYSSGLSGGVSVAHVFVFSVFCFCCLRPMSCVPSIASVSGLSIRVCHFGFL
jgi:hypothetical protein